MSLIYRFEPPLLSTLSDHARGFTNEIFCHSLKENLYVYDRSDFPERAARF